MTTTIRVPFADLVAQNRECADDIRACVARTRALQQSPVYAWGEHRATR